MMNALLLLTVVDEDGCLNEKLRVEFLFDVLEYSKNFSCR